MNKKEIIKLILFPTLLVGAILGLNFGLFIRVSDDLSSYGQFYKEEEKCLDVALIGNSTLREGYVPTEMWHDYAITSRGLSSSPTHPEVIKVAISQVIRYEEPSIVFIDINGLTYQRKSDAEFFIKQYYKALPKGDFKTVLESEYDYLSTAEDDLELFKNHNNFRQQQYWESLVYPAQFITKGYYPNKSVFPVTPTKYDDTTVLPLPEDGQAYLLEIIEECNKYPDVKFVLGKMPRYNTSSSDVEATYMLRSVPSYLEGTNISFKDFTYDAEAIGLDPKTDFKDTEHLNHLGSLKFTDYFAHYLLDDLHLEIKEKKQETIDNFNKAYDDTIDYLTGIENKLKKKTGKS